MDILGTDAAEVIEKAVDQEKKRRPRPIRQPSVAGPPIHAGPVLHDQWYKLSKLSGLRQEIP